MLMIEEESAPTLVGFQFFWLLLVVVVAAAVSRCARVGIKGVALRGCHVLAVVSAAANVDDDNNKTGNNGNDNNGSFIVLFANGFSANALTFCWANYSELVWGSCSASKCTPRFGG